MLGLGCGPERGLGRWRRLGRKQRVVGTKLYAGIGGSAYGHDSADYAFDSRCRLRFTGQCNESERNQSGIESGDLKSGIESRDLKSRNESERHELQQSQRRYAFDGESAHGQHSASDRQYESADQQSEPE